MNKWSLSRFSFDLFSPRPCFWDHIWYLLFPNSEQEAEGALRAPELGGAPAQ